MLRRVARALRGLLFVLGVGMLFWLPVSPFFNPQVVSPWPYKCGILLQDGAVVFWCVRPSEAEAVAPVQHVVRVRWREDVDYFKSLRSGARPRITALSSSWPFVYVWLPLWLLSALCLAWPVTSFIIARRKHKRGFPVEPKSPDATPAHG